MKIHTTLYFLRKMKNFFILSDAISFIEENLREPIVLDDIAAFCHVSLSSLHKLFRYAFRISVGDYIAKRRITCAARDLLSGDDKITEIGFRYCYNSPETFCRAFVRIWGITPSEFRRTRKFTDIFPKLELNLKEGNQMKKVDVSELYNLLRQMKGTYVVCFDICRLSEINAVSHELGDAAILECLRRIETAAGDDGFMFRVGGDEFAMITALCDRGEVEAAAMRVLEKNGEIVKTKEFSTPVSMRAAAILLDADAMRYSDLFPNIQNALIETRKYDFTDKVHFIN